MRFSPKVCFVRWLALPHQGDNTALTKRQPPPTKADHSAPFIRAAKALVEQGALRGGYIG